MLLSHILDVQYYVLMGTVLPFLRIPATTHGDNRAAGIRATANRTAGIRATANRTADIGAIANRTAGTGADAIRLVRKPDDTGISSDSDSE